MPGIHHPSTRTTELIAAFALLLPAAMMIGGCSASSGGDRATREDRAAAGSRAPLNEYTSHLEQELPRLMDRYGVPGVAIAIVRDGAVAWSGAWGSADLATGRPMSVDTICRAESISKPVTAWGVMRLVEQGRIDLDAPVQRYVPDLSFQDPAFDAGAITVEMLLSHRSGLALGTIGPPSEYAPRAPMPTAREFIEQDARIVADPGSRFLYSDVGFNILELTVENVTGEPFQDYMQREVLDPLGMNDSGYGWKADYADAIATGHEIDGTPVEPYVYPAKASGGLFADVDDLGRFLVAEVSASSAQSGSAGQLGRAAIDAMHERRVEIPGLYGFVADGYGYGHFIEQLPTGLTAVWHGGQGHGWMTHFHAVPETGDGIVILTNSQRSWPFLARVLSDWGTWSGVGAVKFGLITRATAVVWAIIALLGIAAAAQLVRILAGLLRGRRVLAPFARRGAVVRALQFVAGSVLILVVAWRLSLPYVDEASIFPTAAPWLAVATIALGVVLVSSALFPRPTGNT